MKLSDLVKDFQSGGSIPQWSELESRIETEEPTLLKICYPRIYRNVEKWCSPKAAAYGHVTALVWVRDLWTQCPVSARSMYVGACMQRQWQFPCYFVECELLDAVTRTDVPDGIRWMDLELPFEAGNLILPRDYLKTPTGDSVEYISWARVRACESHQWGAGYRYVRFAHNTFLFYTMLRNTGGVIYDTNLSENITPCIPKISAHYSAGTRTGVGQLPIDEEESLLIARMRDLTLGLLLILECRPQLVTKGQRAPGVKRKKNMREVWEPTILGRGFRMRSENQDGEHRSPKFHWVGGHLKPNLSERLGRRVWIEPYERGGEIEGE